MCVGTVAEGNVAKGEEPATPAAIYLKDYQEYPYSIADLTMTFDLGEEKTTVHSVCRMSSKSGSSVPMMLNGDASLELKGLYVDGKPLVEGVDYDLSEKELLIKSPPSGDFVLGCITDIEPQNNTSLNGLYKSDGNFCSQCEAEGFRCITYYPDRPDVMTKFTVKIVGDKEKYPVLLSNGNLVAEGDLEGGKHYAVWVDPWKKPAYLFALVAGQYVALEDKFTTKSGRVVDLRIYTAAHNSHKTQHAMDSLKHAMKWDEDRFRLEYDLDLFNIVAADDFNMGAMENKSLNVFNSRLVLASPETATDFDYNRIEGVIGHEYFHNWTGNRVTCRDWFQLSLKEGLTVFRDQEFSSFMNSAPVKRIDDVMIVRSRQFAEDAGPMAHPVRPASYMKIDNFYTLTVYDKGAEVIRMYHTLLGEEGFQKGIDLYFERHDGQAVTTDDFYKAMEDANNTSLGSFKLWYSQAGTPTLKVTTEYNEGDKTFTLNCSQELPVTPDMTQEKKPQLIPIKIGLVSPDGKDLVLTSVQDSTGSETSIGNATTYVLKMTEMSQSFTFKNVPVKPTPSVLRNFSAPVKLEMEQSSEELKFLLSNDSDEFNKWEAGQRLITNLIFDLLKSHQSGQELQMDNSVTEAFGQVLTDDSLDKEFRAYAMELPSTEELADKIPKANPVDIHKVRNFVLKSLAAGLKDKFLQIYNANNVKGAYKPDREGKSRRSIRNCALSYLGKLADSDAEIKALLNTSFKEASNMTDQMAALGAICGNAGEDRENALKSFYTQWSNEPLVMLKWLGLQAGSNIEGNLKVMKELLEHPAFDIKNPNKVYSLVGGFTRSAVNFHAADGSGYEFLADLVIKLDKLNPQVAARMVGPFTKYKKYDDARQALMKAQLERILATKPCENVYEIVFKSL
ncbi:alanyl aminopeptidase [Chloropicon primus]|uniref:Alanyl aminopeptidase n=1 Tax=Chloropicon primus TaxID=1764295 RepID=A0A5B8ME61_9CHLO|nr:alanyl aminopeptidase [Chloropicon primus]UPQ97150.1 alanyl aminopeptidase [Chloropicon primus]|eukprot:QDZ17935.1 alanyl aminopeptidase [Chloropicon primus]